MAVSLVLDDYLGRSDFAEALASLTGDLGRDARLPGRADEVGLVCPNVLLAAKRLEAAWPSMTSFFLGAGSPTRFAENGAETPFTTRVGFGFHKGVILELAEPGVGSQIFGQTPAGDGEIMINHIGFVARGDALVRAEEAGPRAYSDVMRDAGLSKRVEAVLNVLGFIGHIHIFEARGATHGIEVEFLDFRLFSPRGPKMCFPARLIGLGGWLQGRILPRFLRMKARHQLPPAPVPPAALGAGSVP